MAGPRPGGGSVAEGKRRRKKRLAGKGGGTPKPAPQKKPEVSIGESRFGMSGAGSNRALLMQHGSKEAKEARDPEGMSPIREINKGVSDLTGIGFPADEQGNVLPFNAEEGMTLEGAVPGGGAGKGVKKLTQVTSRAVADEIAEHQAIRASQKLIGSNLEKVWRNLGQDIFIMGKKPDKAVTVGAKAVTTKTRKLLEKSYNKLWKDRGLFYKSILIGGAASSMGTGGLDMWWNKESADGFLFNSEEYYDQVKFAKSEEERQIYLNVAQDLHDQYVDAMSRTAIEWIVSFIPIAGPKVEEWKSVDRATTLADTQLKVIEDVAALQNEMGDEVDDIEMWNEYQRRAHENELAEIEKFNEDRIATEQRILDMQAQAEAAGRKEDLRYYEQLYEMQEEVEKEKLEANASFWRWYHWYAAKMRGSTGSAKSPRREDTRPSQLSFGLL